MSLSLNTRKREPQVTVIELGGRLTQNRESEQLETALRRALDEGARRIVIDLSQIAYIDSNGVGILIYCFNRIAQQNAQGAVVNAGGFVLDMFRATRESLVPVYSDLASACEGFTEDPLGTASVPVDIQ